MSDPTVVEVVKVSSPINLSFKSNTYISRLVQVNNQITKKVNRITRFGFEEII